jgi:aspartate beta-hydroxylase
MPPASTDPSKAKVLFRRSKAYQALGKIEEAYEDITEAKHFDQNDDKAIQSHYNLVLKLRKSRAREAQLEEENPERFKQALDEVGRLLSLDSPSHAKEKVSELHRVFPTSSKKSPYLAFYEGCIAQKSNHLDLAIGHYTAALTVLPTLIGARSNIVSALVELGRYQEAIGHSKQSTLLQPLQPERHFELGVIYMINNYNERASEAYQKAIELNPKFKEAYVNLDSVLLKLGALERCREFASKAIDHLSGFWMHKMQRPPHFMPGLRSKPWWDPAEFEWVQKLEDNFEEIQQEVLSLLRGRQQKKSGGSSQDSSLTEEKEGAWGEVGKRAAHDASLVANGRWVEFPLISPSGVSAEARQSCPKTVRALSAIPELCMMAKHGVGETLFSLLEPGTVLRPHCGSTNARLTAHFGLKIPPNCSITAGTERRTWEEGKVIIFDDSYEHHVEHSGDTVRIILLINFWHPDVHPSKWRPLECSSRYNML